MRASINEHEYWYRGKRPEMVLTDALRNTFDKMLDRPEDREYALEETTEIIGRIYGASDDYLNMLFHSAVADEPWYLP